MTPPAKPLSLQALLAKLRNRARRDGLPIDLRNLEVAGTRYQRMTYWLSNSSLTELLITKIQRCLAIGSSVSL
jgi:hypothetical protein